MFIFGRHVGLMNLCWSDVISSGGVETTTYRYFKGSMVCLIVILVITVHMYHCYLSYVRHLIYPALIFGHWLFHFSIQLNLLVVEV